MDVEPALPRWGTDAGVRDDLERQPHLFLRLAENALVVAESIRDNYFKNTAGFVAHLRRAIEREDPIIQVGSVADARWEDVRDEVVTFIDGGVGQIHLSSQAPILLRVGSYSVRTGERRLAERENFGYYPIVLGDLEGGSKEREDFVDLVRITAEFLGGLAALDRTPDLDVLVFHGPLVNAIGRFTGHTPFTERDIDLFLRQYAAGSALADDLKEGFIREAGVETYPRMAPDWADDWAKRRLFEPLAWLAFLGRRLIRTAKARKNTPIVAGVVERERTGEFCERVLLDRVFHRMRERGTTSYFNDLYGRTDLTSPHGLLAKLGYTDSLLLAMVLRPGEYAEPWIMRKYAGLAAGRMALPGEARASEVDWGSLRPPNSTGFPAVQGCYVHVSETTEPIRVEVFEDLGTTQIVEAARRAYLYARLLPGQGFPVGLDIADKYARVPAWLTSAYDKLVRYHLSCSLQRGEIRDADMQRILVQALYMTHRDWLFRPSATEAGTTWPSR